MGQCYIMLMGMLVGSRQDRVVVACVQVATEWLFACPKDVLDRHLHGSTPASPVAHAQDRVTTPRRVGLTVRHHPAPVHVSTGPCSAPAREYISCAQRTQYVRRACSPLMHEHSISPLLRSWQSFSMSTMVQHR